jgi:hypothetical protein
MEKYNQNNMMQHHHHQFHNVGMILGCFIGVMILLVVLIVLMGVGDSKVNSMLVNQNNVISKMQTALGLKVVKGHGGKNRYTNNLTPGSSVPVMPTAVYGGGSAGTFALNNQQFSDAITVGGYLNNNPTLNCGAACNGGGNNMTGITSSGTGMPSPNALSDIEAEAQFFIDMGTILQSDTTSGMKSMGGNKMPSMPSMPSAPSRPINNMPTPTNNNQRHHRR